MRLTIELPNNLADAVQAQAMLEGIEPAGLVCNMLARALTPASSKKPLKTGRGMFATYGQAPSAEEIDANRSDMLRGFAEDF